MGSTNPGLTDKEHLDTKVPEDRLVEIVELIASALHIQPFAARQLIEYCLGQMAMADLRYRDVQALANPHLLKDGIQQVNISLAWVGLKAPYELAGVLNDSNLLRHEIGVTLQFSGAVYPTGRMIRRLLMEVFNDMGELRDFLDRYYPRLKQRLTWETLESSSMAVVRRLELNKDPNKAFFLNLIQEVPSQAANIKFVACICKVDLNS